MHIRNVLFILTISVIPLVRGSKPRIIIDVDPGVDDFQALVILIDADNKGLLKIEAVIVSEGNTEQKYGLINTLRLLQSARRLDIPVHLGPAHPILPHYVDADNYFGNDGFGDLEWDEKPPMHKVSSIRGPWRVKQLLEKHPGQITYINLGPMTNLALTLRMFSGLTDKFQSIYAMGGLQVDNTTAEFNVLFDPESVEIVLATVKCPVYLLTWEACVKNAPERIWFENAEIDNVIFNMMLKAEKSFGQMHPDETTWVSCDPVTACAFLNSTLIEQVLISPLEVNLNREPTRGIVTENHDQGEFARTNVTVITEINYPLMKEMFLDAFDNICKLKKCR